MRKLLYLVSSFTGLVLNLFILACVYLFIIELDKQTGGKVSQTINYKSVPNYITILNPNKEIFKFDKLEINCKKLNYMDRISETISIFIENKNMIPKLDFKEDSIITLKGNDKNFLMFYSGIAYFTNKQMCEEFLSKDKYLVEMSANALLYGSMVSFKK